MCCNFQMRWSEMGRFKRFWRGRINRIWFDQMCELREGEELEGLLGLWFE